VAGVSSVVYSNQHKDTPRDSAPLRNPSPAPAPSSTSQPPHPHHGTATPVLYVTSPPLHTPRLWPFARFRLRPRPRPPPRRMPPAARLRTRQRCRRCQRLLPFHLPWRPSSRPDYNYIIFSSPLGSRPPYPLALSLALPCLMAVPQPSTLTCPYPHLLLGYPSPLK